jgi:hypothetical protein
VLRKATCRGQVGCSAVECGRVSALCSWLCAVCGRVRLCLGPAEREANPGGNVCKRVRVVLADTRLPVRSSRVEDDKRREMFRRSRLCDPLPAWVGHQRSASPRHGGVLISRLWWVVFSGHWAQEGRSEDVCPKTVGQKKGLAVGATSNKQPKDTKFGYFFYLRPILIR